MSNTSDKKKKRRLARQRRQAENSRRQATRGDQVESRIDQCLDEVLRLVKAGQGDAAIDSARALTQQQPESWRAWNLLGTVQDHVRKVEDAEDSFRKVTELAPERGEGWRALAKLAGSRGDTEQAQDYLLRAGEASQQDAALLADMARTFLISQNVPQAVEQIEQAIQLAPEDPDVLNILGLVRQQQGRTEDAALAFCQAAERRENFVDALANLGECLRSLGQLDQAEEILSKTLELDPEHKNALGMMGLLKSTQGDKEASIPFLQEALKRNPRYKLFRLQLARNLASTGSFEEAFENLEYLAETMPTAPEPLLEKAAVHALLADTPKARETCARVLKIDPGNITAQIRSAMALPQVCDSNEEIAWHRENLESTLDRLLQQDLPHLERPLEDFPHAMFYLTYHGYNNRDINIKISELYRRLFPMANYVSPNLANLKRLREPGTRIRVAFVSKNFSNHTIGRLTLGLMQQINRQRFEVSCYTFPSPPDEYREKFIEAADHFEILPGDGDEACQKLAAAQPDLIFYPDIGMDPVTYHLAHTRLAPVQCVTWGHPVTTGISTVDYYMSNVGMDSEASREHYSENLQILDNPFFCYHRPPLLSEGVNKQLLGLPEDFRLYLCPQTLFKFHPDFDQMLGGILRRDPKSLLLLVKLGQESWRERLVARFARTMPDVHRRILWLPRMSAFKFMHFFRLGDVVLDPYRFGSGNSSLEALAMGAPFVTCPDPYLRTRATSTYFQRMGVTDCITSSPEEYIEKAVQIANNPDYRNELSGRILDRSKVLFDNLDAVRELEGWFETTVLRHADSTP